jgi:hypothetical protein
VKPQLPADFQREVWHRIAAEQAAGEDMPAAPAWQAWLSHWFARPAFAPALLVVSLTSGFLIARFEAQRTNERSWHLLEERYAAAVNPLARQVEHLNHHVR